MKKLALSLALLGSIAATGAASAAVSALPNTNTLTTTEARQLVQNSGSIVLATGEGHFDRYVANASECQSNEATQRALVTTKDASGAFIGFTCVINDK
ncbi:hypothetical protein [Flexibacterium corallicola]|uniref:hypothetical protein n=1 Tax=Flexibacterium corallicola TaxID=3037259 RepID=UPI00286EB98E|nr:hypothetical protein [Pseudovibrio sp. M1P-2-3]